MSVSNDIEQEVVCNKYLQHQVLLSPIATPAHMTCKSMHAVDGGGGEGHGKPLPLVAVAAEGSHRTYRTSVDQHDAVHQLKCISSEAGLT